MARKRAELNLRFGFRDSGLSDLWKKPPKPQAQALIQPEPMEKGGDGSSRPKSARPGSARPGGRPKAAMPQTAAAAAGAGLAPNSPRVVCACGIRSLTACVLAEAGPRVEFTGDNAAPKAASAAEVVEAKFYGDGTWNKAILGAQLGPDRQQVCS